MVCEDHDIALCPLILEGTFNVILTVGTRECRNAYIDFIDRIE